jgi:hypothetical protein
MDGEMTSGSSMLQAGVRPLCADACSEVAKNYRGAVRCVAGCLLAGGLALAIAMLTAGETLAQGQLTLRQVEKWRVGGSGAMVSIRGATMLPPLPADPGELKEKERITIENGRDEQMFVMTVHNCELKRVEVNCSKELKKSTVRIPVLLLAQPGKPPPDHDYLRIVNPRSDHPVEIVNYNFIEMYNANKGFKGKHDAFWIKIPVSAQNLDAALVICVECDLDAPLLNVAGASGPPVQTVQRNGTEMTIEVDDVPPDYDAKVVKRLIVSALRGPSLSVSDIRDIQPLSERNGHVMLSLVVNDKALGGLTIAKQQMNCTANACSSIKVSLRQIDVDLTAAAGRDPVPYASITNLRGSDHDLDEFIKKFKLGILPPPTGGHWKGSVPADTLFGVLLQRQHDGPKLVIAEKPRIRLVRNGDHFELDESDPAPPMVRVEFSGPEPVRKMMVESKLGEVRYNGEAVDVKSFAGLEGERRLTLPQDFKITRATLSTGRPLYGRQDYSSKMHYVEINHDDLADGRETVVTIDIDWAQDLKFKVSDPSGVAAAYGSEPVMSYDLHKIGGKNLADALSMNRGKTAIEVTGEYLVASKVESIPQGFATQRTSNPRVIDLDFDKLQPGTDGDVKIDFKRKLPKGFQIQPVVFMGDKPEPYLQCIPYTIDVRGGTTGIPLKRTVLPDGAKGLSLDGPAEGQAFSLKAKCGESVKTVELTPDVLAQKTKAGYAQIEVMKIARFYAGLARSNAIEHEESNNWYETLKLVQDLYGPLRQTEKVQSALLVVENLANENNGIVLPDSDALTAEFPPHDQLPELADRVFNSKDLAANFGFERTLKRLRQGPFRDVSYAVIIDTPQTFSFCKSLVSRYGDVTGGGPAIKVAFINGLPFNPTEADSAFQPLPGSGGEIFQCPGTPPQLRIYAFNATRALQSKKGWKERLDLLQKEIAREW